AELNQAAWTPTHLSRPTRWRPTEDDPHQRLGCRRGDAQKQALKQAGQGPCAVPCYSIQDSRRRTQHLRSHLHHHEQGGDGPLGPRRPHESAYSLEISSALSVSRRLEFCRPRLLLVVG
ncbi:hypothetical protein B0H14DRAFT_3123779, partial [Mycena olivaceomarginata]